MIPVGYVDTAFPVFHHLLPCPHPHLLETVIIIAGKSEKGIRSLFDFIRICPIRLNIILNFRSCPASAEMLVDAGENPRYIGLLIIKEIHFDGKIGWNLSL